MQYCFNCAVIIRALNIEYRISVLSNRLPDVSYEWSCYSSVEEVQTLIDHLSHQGIRESGLKKSLKEQLPTITDGIARRFV